MRYLVKEANSAEEHQIRTLLNLVIHEFLDDTLTISLPS